MPALLKLMRHPRNGGGNVGGGDGDADTLERRLAVATSFLLDSESGDGNVGGGDGDADTLERRLAVKKTSSTLAKFAKRDLYPF